MKKAFTLTEAIVVIVIIGVIGVLYNVGIKVFNSTQKGFEIQANEILESIDQVFNLIYAYNSESFNLADLHDENGNFSITDQGIDVRFVNLFRKYLSVMDLQDKDLAKVKAYYSSNIIDYNRTDTGMKLNDTYSNFINTQNGAVYGFRLYHSCSADEKNANPPLATSRKTMSNMCGSIFYDVNNYRGPNKLGSDQYIIPFNTLGTEVKR